MEKKSNLFLKVSKSLFGLIDILMIQMYVDAETFS